MTDEQLKSALTEVRDHMLTQFPVAEKGCEFSPKFHRKMKQLIKMEKHPLLYQVRRVAAAILVALGVSGGLALGFSEEARAGVIRWFSERFADNSYIYRNNMGESVDVSVYSMEECALDEYLLLERTESESAVDEVYVDKNGNMLFFSAMSSANREEMYVSSDRNMWQETVYIKGRKADLYVSEDSKDSSLIAWEDSNGVLISIKGIMSKEQLIKIAEKIEETKQD